MSAHIPFDHDRAAAFCLKWNVARLALFGSVLRDDFNAASDVDVLVTIAPDAATSYWDWPDMQDELESIFGRKVDLVAAGGLYNPVRRKEILGNSEVIHAA